MKEEYFKREVRPGYTVLELLRERLDLFETASLSKEIESQLKELGHPNIIFDLRNITGIDSSGIGILLAMKNVLEKNKSRMVLVTENKSILKIFTISKVERLFRIFANVDEAVDYLTGEAPLKD